MLFASLSVQQMREREKNKTETWRAGGELTWNENIKLKSRDFFLFFLSRLLYGFFYKKEERATGIAQYISKRKKKRDSLAEMYRSVDFAFGLDLLHILLCHYCICRVYGGYFLFFLFLFFSFFTIENVPPQNHFHSFYYIVVWIVTDNAAVATWLKDASKNKKRRRRG